MGNYLTNDEVFREIAEELGIELPELEMQLEDNIKCIAGNYFVKVNKEF